LPGPLSTASLPNTFTSGTRIAGLPGQVLKFGFDWQPVADLTLGADWMATGSQVVAGNESGNRPELGKLAGSSVLDARAIWQAAARWQAYVRVGNVLDKRYASFATGNRDLFPGGRASQPGADAAASRFLAPGAGRPLPVGVHYEWAT
jgi:outer membrane receptor protein involved in Fe transport